MKVAAGEGPVHEQGYGAVRSEDPEVIAEGPASAPDLPIRAPLPLGPEPVARLVRTYLTCFLPRFRQRVVAKTATRTRAIAATFRTANALNPASLRRYRPRSRCAA
jgi:hypothetical protein